MTNLHTMMETGLQGLHTPWKSLKVLENCSRYCKVLEFQCWPNSLRRTANEKEQTQRPSGENSPDVEELKKDIDSRLLFALNGVLKNAKCVLEKSLNFLFKKGYKPWVWNYVTLEMHWDQQKTHELSAMISFLLLSTTNQKMESLH